MRSRYTTHTALPGSMESDKSSAPLLSLVISSRNDQHEGNSVWWLQTTLNFVGRNVSLLNLCRQVELIVTDWGSDIPLRKVVELSEEACAITRFLEIPPDIAVKEQKDSPFPEVLANNAAIRRARGEFIGRIDQDTLVDKAFLSGFFTAFDDPENESLKSTLMFVGRRSIPKQLTLLSPDFQVVLDFLRTFGKWLPKEGRGRTPWWDIPVGIMLLHRQIWYEAGGYDERMLYWGFMETNLALRLENKYKLIDLEELIDCPFYHLKHSKQRLALTSRRKNPRRRPEPRPRKQDWGLAQYDLRLLVPDPAQRARPQAKVQSRFSSRRSTIPARFVGALLAEWWWETILTFSRRMYRLVRRRIYGEFIGD